MAIQILVHLTASPNPTTLPRRIDFRQTLISNLDAENVVVVYQMDLDHEVWFKDGDGNLTKTIQRTLPVSQIAQPVLTRITMVKGQGAGPMALVEIDQTLTDSTEIAIHDNCELGID